MLVDEAQVRERIERTGVSDAKKRASYPLAKRAGARCAFCVQTHEEVRVEHGGRHGYASTVARRKTLEGNSAIFKCISKKDAWNQTQVTGTKPKNARAEGECIMLYTT